MLDQIFLEVHRRRPGKRGPVGYLDDFEALVAFVYGYFAARGRLRNPDSGWDVFKDWLLRQGAIWDSPGEEMPTVRNSASGMKLFCGG